MTVWTTDDLRTVSVCQVKKFKVILGPPHGPVPIKKIRRKKK
jgi:hypothetical protein